MSGERLVGPGHAPAGKTCHHLHEYGLSCSEYEALRLRTGGHCEICGTAEDLTPGQLLLIDHCHQSGEVRGLVCAKCNTAMACYDGNKPWGANRLWERRAAKYVAAVRLWTAYGQACKELGTTRIEDMRAHIRGVVVQQGGEVEFDDPQSPPAIIQSPRRAGAFPRAECPVCGIEVSFRKDGKPTWHQSRLPGARDTICTASA